MSGQLEFGEEDRSTTLRRAWDLCLRLLATKINTVAFESFIRPIDPLNYTQNVVTLGVNSSFQRERLEKSHYNAIRSALEFHLDTTGLRLEFVVLSNEQRAATPKKASSSRAHPLQTALPLDSDEEEPQPDPPQPKAQPNVPHPAAAPEKPSPARTGARKPEPRKTETGSLPIPSLPLNERYMLSSYLVGRSNRLAHAGAVSVAERPGEVYNPLFLYGGPGLGKSHLLQGIAHALLKRKPNTRVAYVSGEYFAQHYIRALREHDTEKFRRQYREVDVWLVDDIQFIAGKEQTKEEFFHTFNTLYQSGRQIVIASDRSPRELNTMDERLRSRFQSGLIADINPPETETRIAFLQELRKRENADVSDDVLLYMADAIQSNMRTLEGAFTRLVAHASIMNVPISVELAHDVLSEYFIDKPVRYRKVTVDGVIEAVAEHFGTTSFAIKGPSRHKDISLARQIAIYLCRELIPGANMAIIGTSFGRDHATIVYACQRLKDLMDVDPELKMMVSELNKKLSN